MSRRRDYPLGAAVTLAELSGDPHSVLARLRASEPVSWVECLDGWLVTRHDLAADAMSDSRRYTVDDPRFSTGQVIGPSMLSLDGEEHARHRAPFVGPFRPLAVRTQLADAVVRSAEALIDGFQARGEVDLRSRFAGPLAAAVIAHALGLDGHEADDLLRFYRAIVGSVNSITAGAGPTSEGARAFELLRRRLQGASTAGASSLLATAAAQAGQEGGLDAGQIVANAAVLLFGGIETTEAMIANAALALLSRPQALELVGRDPAALGPIVDESLRLEPAAAVIDRYATADGPLGPAEIARGELVRISIAGANRDPAVFADPDAFDPGRLNLRRHLAFAQGPHVCVGVHLARLETQIGLEALLRRLPKLRLDPHAPAQVSGLVFRKPERLAVLWG